jgi:hypothetical protein
MPGRDGAVINGSRLSVGGRVGEPRERLVVVLLGALAWGAGAAVWPVGAVVLAVVVALAVALLLVPVKGVLPLLLFFAPVQMFLTIPGTGVEVAGTKVLVLVVGGAVVLRALGEGRVRMAPFGWGLLAWWLWMMATVLWSIDRGVTLRGMFAWSILFASVAVTVWYLSAARTPAEGIRATTMTFLAVVLTWSLIGLGEVLIGQATVLGLLQSDAAIVLFREKTLDERLATMNFNWLTAQGLRPFGPFLNSIHFGILTGAGIGVAMAALMGGRKLAPRWLAWCAGGAALVANVLAMKLTGWAAAGTAVWLALVANGRSVRQVVVYGLGVAAVIVVLAWGLRTELTGRVREVSERELAATTTTTVVSRLTALIHYTELAAQRPVGGSGLFTANTLGPLRTRASGLPYRIPTENGYLTVGVQSSSGWGERVRGGVTS